MKGITLPAALLLALMPAPVHAQGPPPAVVTTPGPEEAAQGEIPRRGDDDEPDLPGLALGRWFTLGGSAQAEWNTLRRPAGLAETSLEPEAGSAVQLRATITPATGLVFFGRTEWRRSSPTDTPGWWHSGETTGRVVEAYADLDRPLGLPIGVRVGRQRFRDAQEWFFDDYLDAVRLRAQAGRWRFDAALTGALTAAPATGRPTGQRQHVIVTASRRVTRAMRATGVYVRRGDTAARSDTPWWVGGSLASRGEHAVMFHANAAVRRGHSGNTKLRGWAADTMVRWHLDLAGRPALSWGYARASGDASTADGVDGGFRQTDLQDNSTRVGGIRRVRMYGEAFDPELANLQVLTAAVSVRPARLFSIDVIGHRYVQVVARSRLAGNAFDARAGGRDRHLGDELDVQFVARPVQRVDVRLIVGVFRPGGAFDAQQGAGVTTVVWRPQVRVYL